MIHLNEQEQRAVNDFIQEHWGSFKDSALRYLDDEEVEELGERLGQGL